MEKNNKIIAIGVVLVLAIFSLLSLSQASTSENFFTKSLGLRLGKKTANYGYGYAPDAPTNFHAVKKLVHRIKVAWTPPVQIVTQYKIKYGKKPSTKKTKYANGSKTYKWLRGLTPATKYYFKIRAQNDDGNSAYSSLITAWTKPAKMPAKYITPTKITSTSLKFKWKKIKKKRIRYRTRLKNRNGKKVRAKTVKRNRVSFKNLKPDTIYKFQLKVIKLKKKKNKKGKYKRIKGKWSKVKTVKTLAE